MGVACVQDIYRCDTCKSASDEYGRCGHRVNDESVAALLKEAKESGKMQIYICDNKMEGKIDAFGGTPLYTNGQVSVYELVYNGTLVWSRFKQQSQGGKLWDLQQRVL